jgi:hypothetical protein
MQTNANESPQKNGRNITDEEISMCKDNMRPCLKDDPEYGKIEWAIRRILPKMSGCPLETKRCVKWLGESRGNITMKDHTQSIKRVLYHWYREDIKKKENSKCSIVNLEECEFPICCNVWHLRKIDNIEKSTYRKKNKKRKQDDSLVQELGNSSLDAYFRKKEEKKQATPHKTKYKKIDTESAKGIWRDLGEKVETDEICEKFGVTPTVIENIKNGSTWSSVTGLAKNDNNETKRLKRVEKTESEMKLYIEGNCGYTLRENLNEKIRPKRKDVYRFLKGLGTNSKYIPIVSEINLMKKNGTYHPSIKEKDNRFCIKTSSLIKFRKKRQSSARLVYNWFVDDVPEGSRVIRTCSSKHECVRIEHLKVKHDSKEDEGYTSEDSSSSSSSGEDEDRDTDDRHKKSKTVDWLTRDYFSADDMIPKDKKKKREVEKKEVDYVEKAKELLVKQRRSSMSIFDFIKN